VVVIERVPSVVTGADWQLLLRPRRALTLGQFKGLFVLLAGATWLVALVTFSQGNVFAPVFALLDSAVVALSLRWVWRLGERTEVIAWGERLLEVRRPPLSEPALRAHPYWVTLRVGRRRGQAQVWLASRGAEVEVGAFLSEDERLDLAERLKQLLAVPGDGRRADHSLR
jgi:uncharacterized membrane protein